MDSYTSIHYFKQFYFLFFSEYILNIRKINDNLSSFISSDKI